MGFIRHRAIVATCDRYTADEIYEHVKSMDKEVLIGKPQVNGYVTVCITPDGSKEGFETSDRCDKERDVIVAFLNDLGVCFVEVSYGGDSPSAYITRSAWSEDDTL